MINKKFICIFLIFFIFLLVSCNTQKTIKNKYEEDIPNQVSANSNNELHPNYTNFNGFNMTKDNVNL